MMNRLFRNVTALAILGISAVLGQDLTFLTLPPPARTGGMPLMEALDKRQTIRAISGQKLETQTLSNLLWAAFGVNRDKGPRGKAGRTAPSAMNLQEIEIYVAMPEGVYLYEPVPHSLKPVVAKDVRSLANRRPEAAKAPVMLIYVIDTEKKPGPPPGAPPQQQGSAPQGTPQGPPPQGPPSGGIPGFGEVDTGFIGQNVYLFCASEGLAAWFHGTNKEGLAEALNLPDTKKVLWAQTVGVPEEIR
ncbi:MAG: nitroreductase family protein [bacterium]|nr:nitroreductase family protein [bacterium]